MENYDFKKDIAEQVGYLMLGYDDVESFREDYDTSIMYSTAVSDIVKAAKFQKKKSSSTSSCYDFFALKNGDIFALSEPGFDVIYIKNQRHIFELIDIEYKLYLNTKLKVESMSHEERLESLREGELKFK